MALALLFRRFRLVARSDLRRRHIITHHTGAKGLDSAHVLKEGLFFFFQNADPDEEGITLCDNYNGRYSIPSHGPGRIMKFTIICCDSYLPMAGHDKRRRVWVFGDCFARFGDFVLWLLAYSLTRLRYSGSVGIEVGEFCFVVVVSFSFHVWG